MTNKTIQPFTSYHHQFRKKFYDKNPGRICKKGRGQKECSRNKERITSHAPVLLLPSFVLPHGDGGGCGGMREMRDYKSDDKNELNWAGGEREILQEKLS